uniref:C-type lectin domain-containing protein n=1 Tax=Cynoglossus semilaevis TaxID=244447 RepID=A0A3P8VHM8_CYNSE
MFLLLFTLALGAASASNSSASSEPVNILQRGGCPLFWFSFNSRCYKYVSTHLAWADAELYCVSEGANLVSIHSTEEQSFVRSLVQNFDHAEGWTWIGFSDIHKEGSWMWSDGCPAKFLGEPNNGGGIENCGHTNFGTAKNWNDYPCHYKFPSLCATRLASCP